MAKKKTASLSIYNCSKQMIPLQVRAPGGDFFTSEQQIRLDPGKTVALPKTHLHQEQLDNLQRRRMIRIIHDSEAAEAVSS